MPELENDQDDEMDRLFMMERERVLLQADKQMANINRKDNVLRGRGYSIRLAGGSSGTNASALGGSSRSLLGAALANEELLNDSGDEDLLLKDFDD